MTPAREGALELAHARLSSRYGALADEPLWARLGVVREYATLLEAMRGSVLERWVRGVAPGAPVHAIEAALRAAWRDEVRQVASWMPRPWQAAVAWWSTWFELALVQHVARGAPLPAWLASDAFYQDGDPRSAEHARLAATRRLMAADGDAAGAWLSAWRERCAEPAAPGIRGVARLLSAAPSGTTGGSAGRAAHARRRALVLLFRRSVLKPAAAFCYLAIVAIDIARLRGELVRSALFAHARPSP